MGRQKRRSPELDRQKLRQVACERWLLRAQVAPHQPCMPSTEEKAALAAECGEDMRYVEYWFWQRNREVRLGGRTPLLGRIKAQPQQGAKKVKARGNHLALAAVKTKTTATVREGSGRRRRSNSRRGREEQKAPPLCVLHCVLLPGGVQAGADFLMEARPRAALARLAAPCFAHKTGRSCEARTVSPRRAPPARAPPSLARV